MKESKQFNNTRLISELVRVAPNAYKRINSSEQWEMRAHCFLIVLANLIALIVLIVAI